MTALNKRPKREDMYWGGPGDLGGYMLTVEELEQATAKSDQSGYDLYTADQLSAQEIESATAEYHMYKDMSAMAARIDQLEEENDRLQRKADERLAMYIAKNEQYLTSKGLIP